MKSVSAFLMILFVTSFIFIFVSPAAQYDSEVYQVQKALKSRGYDPGPLDGLWGGSTRNAIEQYQRDSSLPITGMLDHQTKSKLGIISSERGVSVLDESGKELVRYQKSYALLIGMSKYSSGWADLDSVPDELDQVEKILKTQGFHNVVKRIDLDADKLRRVIETFISDYGFERDNRLLFFFSGHGHTLKGPWGRESGYIVPVDAPDPRVDKRGFKRKAVEMEQIRTWISKIDARHVLFLFDSCFSGTVFTYKSGKDLPPAIADATSEPVRQFITAGKARQRVPARSVFTPAFVDAIEKRRGDLNGDNYITGSELAMHLKDEVPRYVKQNPQEGCIGGYKMCQGDFVFVLSEQLARHYGNIHLISYLDGKVYIDGNYKGNIEEGVEKDFRTNIGQHLIEIRGVERSYSHEVTVRRGKTQQVIIRPTQEIDEETIELTNNLGMKFMRIPTGKFMMGSKLSPDDVAQKYGGEASWYKDEHPQHEVRIREAFYLQTTEVTVGQLRMFIKETGYKTEAETRGGCLIWDGSEWRKRKGTYWDNPGFSQDNRHPATCVSWNDVQEFIRWLNRKEGTDQYRLPTESEWEYACQAGSVTVFSFGDDARKLTDYAWYNDNSGNRTYPVAQKKANKWGLFDMQGNVWEWVEDDWHDNYDGAPADGSARVEKNRGAVRVFRGCSWVSDAEDCRSANRDGDPPGYRYYVVGFRLARSVRANTQIIEPSFSVGHIEEILPSLKLIIVKLDTLIANNTKIFIKNKGGHKIFLELLEMDEKLASFKLSDSVYGIAIGDVVYTER